ncbi:hypothetical protein PDQ62_16585 [Bacillus cereus group sp. Bc029]|uniref:hypothetical protein n=1 Tax=Bacillus cereus group sp. Bc029 TaxID=3018121 RepID=UPI0022E550AB|nr:hypothetical protein [Bacillus cereus group sp. Bc029]MDA2681090.1 hypothetical protein [Bacillus cereus group sp. Bc029]
MPKRMRIKTLTKNSMQKKTALIRNKPQQTEISKMQVERLISIIGRIGEGNEKRMQALESTQDSPSSAWLP